jgi:hypothetical protein
MAPFGVVWHSLARVEEHVLVGTKGSNTNAGERGGRGRVGAVEMAGGFVW